MVASIAPGDNVARAAQRLVYHPVAAHAAALENLARLPVDEQRSLERMFSRATKLIADTLGVERVGIWRFNEDATELRCACQYARSTQNYRSGEVLRRADFAEYFQALEDYRAIVADDARNHPLTRCLADAYLVPNGITSMLDASLIQHDDLVGVVCHEHLGSPRSWSHAETSFVASVADLIAVAMEQAAHIEARRELDDRAKRANEEHRMASLGRVAAAVGHDFGHLLTIVLSHAQEILAVPNLPATAAEHATSVVDAIRRSRELTRQLAELGRNGDAAIEPTLLDATATNAANLLRSMPRHGQRIELELAATDARVGLDATRIDQVLMNLVGNALDATREGCTVRIATRITDDDTRKYAVLRVSDDGAGIDEDTRAHIFEPYFTTKRDEGTGLGLAIVHALVERAGGFISVDSAKGRGTSVEVYLPVVG